MMKIFKLLLCVLAMALLGACGEGFDSKLLEGAEVIGEDEDIVRAFQRRLRHRGGTHGRTPLRAPRLQHDGPHRTCRGRGGGDATRDPGLNRAHPFARDAL